MLEVSEFIVVAPANQGMAVDFAQERIRAHLVRAFPHYSFRIEPYGPLCDDEDYTVVPIMNRRPALGEQTDPDQIFMCKPLDPRVIPQIAAELRQFVLAGAGVN